MTLKGYQKKRTDLFIREGLKHNEADEEQPKVSSDGQVEAAKTEKTDELNDYRIFGRHECIQVLIMFLFQKTDVQERGRFLCT